MVGISNSAVPVDYFPIGHSTHCSVKGKKNTAIKKKSKKVTVIHYLDIYDMYTWFGQKVKKYIFLQLQ